ncbi:Tetratricopeptide repeat-containing domain [Macleaya cordata]|uniref:Tetratricopeptide repeat-containing domain n=1 Tax=Macleaya cordata TaxID=56857 RepID=A0A200QG49_MACCD|nr:Tetratricopeptide repeat-containing domain [Macleaya cordata]
MANPNPNYELLRGFELRLLRCSLPPPPPPPPPVRINDTPLPPSPSTIEPIKVKTFHQLIEEILSLIETGNYVEALSSDAVRIVFGFTDSWEYQDSIDCADQFYNQVEKTIESFLSLENTLVHLSISEPEDESNWSSRAFLLVCIGVAAFLAFTQSNVTGPSEEFPSFPLPFSRGSKEDKSISTGVEWDMWARNQLMFTGSFLLGKFSIIQYIVYAKMLLMKVKDLSFGRKDSSFGGTRSISWWLSRIILLQQRILDERSSSLLDLLQVLMRETLDHFGNLEKITSYWGAELYEGEALTVLSMAHLQAGIMEYTYGRIDPFRSHLKSAEEASGLQLSVTGILGYRTVHQVNAKAQMVLVANTNMSRTGDTCSTISSDLQKDVSRSGEDKLGSPSSEIFGASDILMIPKLLENGEDSGIGASDTQTGGTATIPLWAIQQAVILAQCLLIEKSTPYGEMQKWEMAPYIEAVDAQQSPYFIIRCFCDILRIRWESTRSRTKERALMMMDKLVQGVYESSPGAAERIHFSYEVCVPTIPALRKEYGELLVSFSMIGEALKIFQDLELWDNLIHCYCLLEKKAAAVELIKARLCEVPNDPRLWCSLGDVTNNDAHYEKALEVSNNRSARAKRSLARSAYNRGDYEESKILWESAMALNSLYPDGWFALGAAALKARDIDKALDGFSRAIQLDPDNGEAWNNIACLHMIKKRNKEAFIAFKEALKFRRNSWPLWENYSQVAVEIGNLRQALEATKTVLDLTNNKRIDAELLEKVMVEMEAQALRHSLLPSVGGGDPDDSFRHSVDDSKHQDAGMTKSLETDHLVELVGKVLQQIVRGGGGENIWGLYARWHKIKGDLIMCSEALLKQVRSYQGADLWNNGDKFKKFANASLQLCKVYMEISSSTGSRRELNTAEMHLRNTIKQAVNFSDTDELRDLQACLDEVKKRLQDNSISANGNT